MTIGKNDAHCDEPGCQMLIKLEGSGLVRGRFMAACGWETRGHDSAYCPQHRLVPLSELSAEQVLKAKQVLDGMARVKEWGNEQDMVNHPKHYNAGKFEVIDVIDDWKLNFARGCVVKYVARAQHKGTELEDLKKAAWYLNYEIEQLESLHNIQVAETDDFNHGWSTEAPYSTICGKPAASHMMCGNDALDSIDCPTCVARLKKDGFRK